MKSQHGFDGLDRLLLETQKPEPSRAPPNIRFLDDFREPKAPKKSAQAPSQSENANAKRLAKAINYWNSSYKAARRCVFQRTLAVVALDEVFGLVACGFEPARATFRTMHAAARAEYGLQVLAPEHFERATVLGLLKASKKRK